MYSWLGRRRRQGRVCWLSGHPWWGCILGSVDVIAGGVLAGSMDIGVLPVTGEGRGGDVSSSKLYAHESEDVSEDEEEALEDGRRRKRK